MSKTLSLAVDMGAKYNGVFVALSEGKEVLERKATTFIIDEKKINFSKKSRRENRHKDRNYKREKLAKRLFEQMFPLKQYTQEQQELLRGLLNNRGYTFLSSSVEFETLEDSTYEFVLKYLPQLGQHKTKEEFESYLTDRFDEESELKKYLQESIEAIKLKLKNLNFYANKKKILKDIQNLSSEPSGIKKFECFDWVKDTFIKNGLKIDRKDPLLQKVKNAEIDLSAIDFKAEKKIIESLEFDAESIEAKKEIESDLKALEKFFASIIKEIDTGAKPRQKYLKEIQKEIDTFDFIEDKQSLFRLVGNISNFQLRLLRKLFNLNSKHKSPMQITTRYFKAFHYKTKKEKNRRKELFEYLNKYPEDLKVFLQNTPPHLTIPPYEDMNNRDTYKCNTLYIKPEEITPEIQDAIDTLMSNPIYEPLKIDEYGELNIQPHIIHRPVNGNKTVARDFTYSKYLQRFFDATPEITGDEFNPRNIFKHEKKLERGAIDTVALFKKEFGEEIYRTIKRIADKYYTQEEQILSGLYVEKNSIFEKCNRNTPYKNNIKHVLLKPIYDEEFSKDDADNFIEAIRNERGLTAYLEKTVKSYSSYQNGFYTVIQACMEHEKCVADKEIKYIVNGLDKALTQLKNALHETGKYNTYLESVESITEGEEILVNRFVNTVVQTHEILFKELGGFHKTCALCTHENAIRSNESKVLAKRLLSDVGKPIDGMLDMMLDRIAFEISEEIEEDMLKGSDNIEIILEQNKFSFEQSLNDVKRAMNSSVKKLRREYKDRLNVPICPYSGESFNISEGDWDHILPQSKGVYNSKANMILVSTKGNQDKGNRIYTLEQLNKKHLKAVFGTDNIEEIKKAITEGVESIDSKKFTNFDNLKLMQQIALRYALFMRDTTVFDKAFELVKQDKIKNRSNGTQKRLARLIYEKLSKKYPNEMKDKKITTRVISSQLVSATRNLLADSNEALRKQTIQTPHSHAVDAMVLFYLANAKLKGAKHRQQQYVSEMVPVFDFEDIYLETSGIRYINKRKRFINAKQNEIASYPLFDGTIYAEHYKHIKINSLKPKQMQLLIDNGLLFERVNGKKIFVEDYGLMQPNKIYHIDVQKSSDLICRLFENRDEKALKSLKFLDKLRYFTSRKELLDIFFDPKRTKLVKPKSKDIPPYSAKLYDTIYNVLNNAQLFKKEDEKVYFDEKRYMSLIAELFRSKQKNAKSRKRGKKRHEYKLPAKGSPKFRIRRPNNTWQILGNNDIATKNYIIDGKIVPVPYFSKNTIPLAIDDLLTCLLLDKDAPSVYRVDIDIVEILDYVKELTYTIKEANRCEILVTFNKNGFRDINFDLMDDFNCKNNNVYFNKFVYKYIEGDSKLSSYVGLMRDNKLDKKNKGKDLELKAVAQLIGQDQDTITLQYMSEIRSEKKEIILKNLNHETHHRK